MPRKVRKKISPQSFNSIVNMMMVTSIVSSPELMATSGSKGRTAFQWGGSIFTIEASVVGWIFRIRLLLILNRRGQRPSVQTLLLVLSLFMTFPTGLFKILRGQFGCWVAFLAVAANLFFPEVFPASRFVLFVITPSWLANGLRDSIVGVVFCLIIGLLLVIMEFRRIEGCSHFCFWYFFGIFFLLFFTILSLSLGPW